MNFANLRRKLLDWHMLQHDRNQSLGLGRNLRNLPLAPFGAYGSFRYEKDDRVGRLDEVDQFALPLLPVGQVARIYGASQAAGLEGFDDLHGAREILARIRNEYVEFGVGGMIYALLGGLLDHNGYPQQCLTRCQR